ncbi:hypothetical protein PENSPDRAFT_656874 [Peniophora sp. CONT]|nr:hypothetical protein PENSPDRAFT_656874 [Peniophora sp. CONT]
MELDSQLRTIFLYPQDGLKYTVEDRWKVAKATPYPYESAPPTVFSIPLRDPGDPRRRAIMQIPPVFRLGWETSLTWMSDLVADFQTRTHVWQSRPHETFEEIDDLQAEVVVDIAGRAGVPEELAAYIRLMPVLTSDGGQTYALTVGNSAQSILNNELIIRIATTLGLEMANLKWHLCAVKWYWIPGKRADGKGKVKKAGKLMEPLELVKLEESIQHAYELGQLHPRPRTITFSTW